MITRTKASARLEGQASQPSPSTPPPSKAWCGVRRRSRRAPAASAPRVDQCVLGSRQRCMELAGKCSHRRELNLFRANGRKPRGATIPGLRTEAALNHSGCSDRGTVTAGNEDGPAAVAGRARDFPWWAYLTLLRSNGPEVGAGAISVGDQQIVDLHTAVDSGGSSAGANPIAYR